MACSPLCRPPFVAHPIAAHLAATGLWRNRCSRGKLLAVARRDMELMNVPQAHELTEGRRSIIIGLIDGGVDYTHPGATPHTQLI